jgi:hypothetical protein
MVEDMKKEAKDAERAVCKRLLEKIDAATDEDAKLEVIAKEIRSIANGAIRYGMMSAMGGATGFKSILGGGSFNIGAMGDDKRVKCKKCEKDIIERYAKQRLGFCKACFDAGASSAEVL